MLRPTKPIGPAPLQRWNLRDLGPVHMSIAAGAAGPIGGDDVRLSIEVGAGAALILRGVAATVVLPGPHGRTSHTTITVRVDEAGALIWLPGPVIAARNCAHCAVTRVLLHPSARLFLREELLLGRHGEPPGALRQRLRICRGDYPLYDQELAVGPGTAGWNGPAVTGGRRALGSVLIVDPDWDVATNDVPESTAGTDTALFRLSGPAILVSALANDALALRHRLNAGVAQSEARPLQGCSA
jgi:urease accessory protein